MGCSLKNVRPDTWKLRESQGFWFFLAPYLASGYTILHTENAAVCAGIAKW